MRVLASDRQAGAVQVARSPVERIAAGAVADRQIDAKSRISDGAMMPSGGRLSWFRYVPSVSETLSLESGHGSAASPMVSRPLSKSVRL